MQARKPGEQVRQRRQQPWGGRPPGHLRARHPGVPVREHRPGAGGQVPDQFLERGERRRMRAGALGRTPHPQDAYPVRPQPPGGLVEQPAQADPRLSGEGQDRAVGAARHRRQRGELPPAADEGARCPFAARSSGGDRPGDRPRDQLPQAGVRVQAVRPGLRLPVQLVGVHGLPAAAQPQQDLQEHPADVTGRRVGGQDLPQRADRPFGVCGRPVLGGEHESRLPTQRAQVTTTFGDERLAPVAGQQFRDQGGQRAFPRLRRERPGPGRLHSFPQIDPDQPGCQQQFTPGPRPHVPGGGARNQVRFQGPAHGVQRDPQTARGSRRLRVRPEQRGQPVAAHPPSLGQGERPQQSAGAEPGPSVLGDLHPVPEDVETAEQLDVE